MSEIPGPTEEHAPPSRGRTWRWLGFGVLAAVLLLVGAVVVMAVVGPRRDVPSFPSLAEDPDPSLPGTVAYMDGDCVRIVALAGQPSREVHCLPPFDLAEAAELGKPAPPQLVWLGDGLLEVTVFRMSVGPGAELLPGWQQIVDVRTGEVTDVPDDQAPTAPNLDTRPVVSPDGDRIEFTSNSQSGHVTITLTDASGTSRTLLDERGPGKYAYGLNSAFWAPDFEHVIADDGRILVITTSDPPLVRVLTEGGGGNPFGDPDPRHAGFAVTLEDLLAPTG